MHITAALLLLVLDLALSSRGCFASRIHFEHDIARADNVKRVQRQQLSDALATARRISEKAFVDCENGRVRGWSFGVVQIAIKVAEILGKGFVSWLEAGADRDLGFVCFALECGRADEGLGKHALDVKAGQAKGRQKGSYLHRTVSTTQA